MMNNKLMKRGVLLLLAFLFIVGGCSNQKSNDSSSTSSTETVKETSEEKPAADQLISFKDSAGREVKVPKDIKKIAPSGAVAQVMLYSLAPDKLVGLANPISAEAKPYLLKEVQELPTFGQFYGKNSNLNMEALSAAGPQVIIDIGEAKKTVKEDMDLLQKQIGIPVVFIEASLEDSSSAYHKLGELLDMKKEADERAAYTDQMMKQAAQVKQAVTEENQKSVYLASGTDGLSTNASGSFQAQVLDVVGAKNAAVGVEVSSKGGGTIVSLEQIMQWNPDVILADSQSLYEMILNDEAWKELNAVKEKKVYRIPNEPYSFFSSPPSINRLLGIDWLDHLLYAKETKSDLKEQIKQYYQLFYHTELTDKQMEQILANAL